MTWSYMLRADDHKTHDAEQLKLGKFRAAGKKITKVGATTKVIFIDLILVIFVSLIPLFYKRYKAGKGF